MSDDSYSIADIQDYFEFIIKKRETLTENPSIQIYHNKIKNRIIFKVKSGYKLDLLTPETMKLLGSIKKVVDKDKNGENVSRLESVQVVLVHCNLVKNDYQHTSKVLFTFVPNKEFRQLINISPHCLTMMNTINTEFSSVKVWFTGQESKVVQKTAEATGDLIGYKIADNITSEGKSKEKEKEKADKPEETYIPPEKRQHIIDDLKLF